MTDTRWKLLELSRKMFLGSRARPVRRTDDLTIIYDPIVYTMWDPQHFTNL
jgi:hypothetical protein